MNYKELSTFELFDVLSQNKMKARQLIEGSSAVVIMGFLRDISIGDGYILPDKLVLTADISQDYPHIEIPINNTTYTPKAIADIPMGMGVYVSVLNPKCKSVHSNSIELSSFAACVVEGAVIDSVDEKGRIVTRKYNPKIDDDKEEKNGCYIATSVYGSYDCPEVWVLRRFRDKCLKKYTLGRLFIKFYYAISPRLVSKFGDKKVFSGVFKPMLDNLVNRLMDEGYESTNYYDDDA